VREGEEGRARARARESETPVHLVASTLLSALWRMREGGGRGAWRKGGGEEREERGKRESRGHSVSSS
jgi:hypothetical protein